VHLVPLAFLVVPASLPAAEKISPPPLGPDVVSPAIERAIERGLDFLVANQRPDGSFGKSRWERFPTYPTAMTALAGMALLAGGSTPTRGPHARQVRAAADYLLDRCANADGSITDLSAGEERPMYSHAFAMTFLAHLHGHEESEERRLQVRDVLRRAVRFTIGAQVEEGGWSYRADYEGDDEGTLTVTQLQALRSCRDAGIYVPRETIDRAIHYIEISTNPDGSVRYRPSLYRVRHGVTCAALVTLWNAGRHDDELTRRISAYIRARIDVQFTDQRHAEYVMYYLAQARFLLGGDDWPGFYRRYAAMLADLQLSDGSWDGSDGGEIYGSAIALLALQLPYNRLPIYQR
jgi:squalene cyclase